MKKAIPAVCFFLCFIMIIPVISERGPWNCPTCGQKGITANFCEQCGTKAPETWECSVCGSRGNSGKYCANCGTKKEIAIDQNTAETVPFILRNGIRFGMTKEEVSILETLPREPGVPEYYGYGTVSGIADSAVQYHFNSDKKLRSVEIDYSQKYKKGYVLMTVDFEAINGKLRAKYGEPLGNTGGACHYIQGPEFGTLMRSYSSWAILGCSIDYDEWVIDVEGGHVKIDHFLQTSRNTDTNSHILEYTFFTDDDIENSLNDI